jgi:hypothetical protein
VISIINPHAPVNVSLILGKRIWKGGGS